MFEVLFYCENYFYIGVYVECVDVVRVCVDVDGVDVVRCDVFVV